MIGVQLTLEDGQSLLEQRDRVADLARGQISGGEGVPRVQGVWMASTQQPLEVPGQRLTGRDGLRGSIAQLNQVEKRDEPEPQQKFG